MAGRQAVAGRDADRSARGQVDPIEMTDQRDVGRGRAQGEPLRQVPLRIAGLAHPEVESMRTASTRRADSTTRNKTRTPRENRPGWCS